MSTTQPEQHPETATTPGADATVTATHRDAGRPRPSRSTANPRRTRR